MELSLWGFNKSGYQNLSPRKSIMDVMSIDEFSNLSQLKMQNLNVINKIVAVLIKYQTSRSQKPKLRLSKLTKIA